MLHPSSSPSSLNVSGQNPLTPLSPAGARTVLLRSRSSCFGVGGEGVCNQAGPSGSCSRPRKGVGHLHSGPCPLPPPVPWCQEPETRPGLPTRRGFLCFHPARPETPPEVPLGCLNFKVPRGVLPFQGGGSYRRSSWELGRGVGGLERQKKQGGLRTAAPAVAELCATLGGRYLHSVF